MFRCLRLLATPILAWVPWVRWAVGEIPTALARSVWSGKISFGHGTLGTHGCAATRRRLTAEVLDGDRGEEHASDAGEAVAMTDSPGTQMTMGRTARRSMPTAP